MSQCKVSFVLSFYFCSLPGGHTQVLEIHPFQRAQGETSTSSYYNAFMHLCTGMRRRSSTETRQYCTVARVREEDPARKR